MLCQTKGSSCDFRADSTHEEYSLMVDSLYLEILNKSLNNIILTFLLHLPWPEGDVAIRVHASTCLSFFDMAKENTSQTA